jgi:hypothetical protein
MLMCQQFSHTGGRRPNLFKWALNLRQELMRDKWKHKIGVGITEEKRSGLKNHPSPVVYPGILFGGSSTNSVEDSGQRKQGSGGSNPLVRGSGGSCNLVQEISFHIVKFS